MIANPWIAGLFAVFLWWFSTGAILWVVRRADNQTPDGHVMTAILAMPVLFAGVIGLLASLPDPSAGGSWIGFVAAIAIWGWIELVFLSGLVLGPNRRPCPANVTPSERFWKAWGAVAYHELLLVSALAGIAILSQGAANDLALWTFAVLFVARIFAKLNIFFGVPRINTELLSEPLSHLPSYFRIGPSSRIYPVTLALLACATGAWLVLLAETGDVAFAFLAAITALALIEHALMVLPLPEERLWQWMIPAKIRTTPSIARVAAPKLPAEEPHGL
ncbi:MAG: putative photosynthetic complex assembly protein PuhE [Pseudomonadota bacterium]